MGKNKLKKFKEMESLDRVFQFPFACLEGQMCPLRGKWNDDVFHNQNPITLELGCGKGEYTVGLARRFPDRNFIGIDIKGARMWSGAKEAANDNILNAAFLRTSIELLDRFFAPGEVDQIWITFPDPQMKKTNKRLTSKRFQELYLKTLPSVGGLINLKTDSPFLYRYTRDLLLKSGLQIVRDLTDVHGADKDSADAEPWLDEITTHYERQWMSRGLTIKHLAWILSPGASIQEPDQEPEPDEYRSYHRDQAQFIEKTI